ncbi:MAG: hypothetical protein H0U45_15790 [Tatlockia sp.]|nr:hypothetical protein [Tatlockia sp.]
MPFSKSAQIKGGRRLATESQKAVARKWMRENQPWKKSTGPKSILGKEVSCGNAIRAVYQNLIKSWECDDFDFECLKAEAVFAEFDQVFRNGGLEQLNVALYGFQGST